MRSIPLITEVLTQEFKNGYVLESERLAKSLHVALLPRAMWGWVPSTVGQKGDAWDKSCDPILGEPRASPTA